MMRNGAQSQSQRQATLAQRRCSLLVKTCSRSILLNLLVVANIVGIWYSTRPPQQLHQYSDLGVTGSTATTFAANRLTDQSDYRYAADTGTHKTSSHIVANAESTANESEVTDMSEHDHASDTRNAQTDIVTANKLTEGNVERNDNTADARNVSSIDYMACCGAGHRLSKMSSAHYLAQRLNFSLRTFWGYCDGKTEVFRYVACTLTRC
jgi:sensor c-di-GMP phosphodiesterase-like protein